MNYGLQLYSVRDAAEQNFADMLRQVAEMGYRMVEPAGFFGGLPLFWELYSGEDCAKLWNIKIG